MNIDDDFSKKFMIFSIQKRIYKILWKKSAFCLYWLCSFSTYSLDWLLPIASQAVCWVIYFFQLENLWLFCYLFTIYWFEKIMVFWIFNFSPSSCRLGDWSGQKEWSPFLSRERKIMQSFLLSFHMNSGCLGLIAFSGQFPVLRLSFVVLCNHYINGTLMTGGIWR